MCFDTEEGFPQNFRPQFYLQVILQNKTFALNKIADLIVHEQRKNAESIINLMWIPDGQWGTRSEWNREAPSREPGVETALENLRGRTALAEENNLLRKHMASLENRLKELENERQETRKLETSGDRKGWPVFTGQKKSMGILRS